MTHKGRSLAVEKRRGQISKRNEVYRIERMSVLLTSYNTQTILYCLIMSVWGKRKRVGGRGKIIKS